MRKDVRVAVAALAQAKEGILTDLILTLVYIVLFPIVALKLMGGE